VEVGIHFQAVGAYLWRKCPR